MGVLRQRALPLCPLTTNYRYIVADGGEAAVLDPKGEIEEYLQIAEDKGFKIAHILETHNHAL